MKKRMIIVTALIMGTLGAGFVSVQASDTLPELTKDNALEQMMKAGETDSLVSNHKSYEATCEYILQNTKVYDYEDSEVMYVDMYGTTQMLYIHIENIRLRQKEKVNLPQRCRLLTIWIHIIRSMTNPQLVQA